MSDEHSFQYSWLWCVIATGGPDPERTYLLLFPFRSLQEAQAHQEHSSKYGTGIFVDYRVVPVAGTETAQDRGWYLFNASWFSETERFSDVMEKLDAECDKAT